MLIQGRTGFKRLLGVAIAISVLAFVRSPDASADGIASYSSESPDGGAFASFNSYGEIFNLYDYLCDGRVPRLQYKVGTGGSVSTAENHGGCHSDPLTVNKSYAEGTVIYFRACTIAANYSSCDSWIRATA